MKLNNLGVPEGSARLGTGGDKDCHFLVTRVAFRSLLLHAGHWDDYVCLDGAAESNVETQISPELSD